MPDSQALIESRRFAVRPVHPLRPLAWLRRGWGDLVRCPLPGLLHGLVLAVFGATLALLARDRFWLLAGAFSGFLLVAPLPATGMYAISRALERGERPGWRTVLAAWRPERRMVRFGVLLALAGTGWVITSASLITGFAPIPVERPIDFLRGVVLAEQGHLFETWLLLGAVLAAPVYASSVVALPMLLDRPVGVMTAVLTSWRVVQAHPLPLALWAGLLLALSLLGMASALAGLVIVAPWLAHASWHAYRDLVDTTGAGPRP